jgi:TetR/AcrR family transcriptional regulator, regulator of autoinduction and epiphytic fitness
MKQPVKLQRPYRSPKHQAMRRATRQSVVAAAGRLFKQRGYAGTSIQAIAEAAGVAVPTVYAAFGNKRSILWALLETTIGGADQPRPAAERLREQVIGVADPMTRLQKMMRFAIPIIAQAAQVQRVMRGAAAADPQIQLLLDEAEARRYRDCQIAARLIIGAVDDDARTRRFADITFALTSSYLFELLIEERGWSVPEVERWVVQTLAAELPPR